MEMGQIIAILGIALSVSLPGIGSAKAVGKAGEAGAGIIAEDPDKFGQVLVLQALPATQGIYGLLVGFIMMTKINMLGTMVPVDVNTGWQLFGAALPIIIVGPISAVIQGKTVLAGLGLIAKRPEESGKAITLAVMVETYAVLALLASILMVNGIAV
ncbi:MAG TPA: V-type ATP synthase subunit K [Clostridiales bacterium]|nr:V-type ATP synthase subunit K [Clostridiales bacterium]